MGASGFSVGNRVEVESTEMKKNHRPESLLVAKAAGRFPEGSDPGVDAFGRAVTDPIFEKMGR